MSNLSDKIMYLRKRTSLLIKPFADAAGIPVDTMMAIEEGNRDVTPDMLVKIADALNLSLEFLVDRKRAVSFKDWLARFRYFDTPIGDFAFDVFRSPWYPEEESYENLLAYFENLADKHADIDIMGMFKTAWGAWLFYNELFLKDQ